MNRRMFFKVLAGLAAAGAALPKLLERLRTPSLSGVPGLHQFTYVLPPDLQAGDRVRLLPLPAGAEVVAQEWPQPGVLTLLVRMPRSGAVKAPLMGYRLPGGD